MTEPLDPGAASEPPDPAVPPLPVQGAAPVAPLPAEPAVAAPPAQAAPPPPPAPAPPLPPAGPAAPPGAPPPGGDAHLPPPPGQPGPGQADPSVFGSIGAAIGGAVAAVQQAQQVAQQQWAQQQAAGSVGVGAPPAPQGQAPGAWTPPPGWVPPPPPAGYVPPQGITEIVEVPVNPVRKAIFTLLFLVVLVGGVGGGVWLSVQSFLEQNRQINAMARGPVPVAVLELEADARETIHLEHDGLSAGDSESPNRRAEQLKSQARSARVTVTALDGRTLPIEGVGGDSVYGFGHEGIAVGRIAVPEDGEYRVEVEGFPSTGEVAIGDVSFGQLFKDFGIGLGLFILSIFLAIPLFRARIPRAVRRARRA